MQKKHVALLILAPLLVVGGLAGLQEIRSYKTVEIVYGQNIQGVETKVYKRPLHKGKPLAADQARVPDNLTIQIKASQKIRLKQGDYLLVTTGNEQYAGTSQEFTVKENDQTIQVNPAYSRHRLDRELPAQLAAIEAAIRESVALPPGYRLNKGALYNHGEWYGTTIIRDLSDEEIRTSYTDVFRVVAHKQAGTWRVVTNPPELIISHRKYEQIPRSVLIEVNQQFTSDQDRPQ